MCITRKTQLSNMQDNNCILISLPENWSFMALFDGHNKQAIQKAFNDIDCIQSNSKDILGNDNQIR